MPRVRRHKKRRRTGYTQDHVTHLLTGHDFVGAGFGVNDRCDVDAMREGWKLLRDELLPDWIEENPGTRPYAWWKFDAPERRLRIDGKVHPFDNAKRKAHIEEIAALPGTHADYRAHCHRMRRGVPCVITCRDDDEAEYETEAAYLDRLGLLTDGERKALKV